MSALAQCDAFAYIYDQAGDPAPDILVVLKRVLDASGNPILLGPKTTTTDSAGSFHFTLPEFATAFISARASALWNCPEGRAFTVPPGPSGELVPDFSLPASTLVEPPLVYVGDVLSIPKASATQDGYLSAADYVAFLAAAGAGVGISQINTGAGLTGGPITDIGTISLATISGVAGTWSNPTSISINAYGQIIAIAATADTTAPVISAISSGTPGATNATITWTTDDFSDSQVEYGGPTTSYGSSTTLDTTPVLSHSVPLSGLTAGTPYHYRVKSRNTAGLLTTSGDNTFTTTAGPDVTAPVITLAGTPVTVITETGATINWTTDEVSDSQVDYSIDTSYGTSTPITNPVPGSGVTTHAVALTSLTASQLYHYRVKSKDAAGNPATPVTGTFMTATPAETVNLLDHLVSYWAFEEASGTRMDSVTASHNDLLVNNTIGQQPGVVGNAAISNIGGDGGGWLSHADNATLDFTGTSITVAGWMKLHSTSAVHSTLIAKWFTGSQDFALWYRSDSVAFEFAVSSDGTATTTVVADIPGPATLNQWYFLCAIYDRPNAQIKLSVDNGAFTVVTFPGPSIYHSATDMAFLAGAATLAFATVDESGIWNRILNGTEITHLATRVTYPFP